MIEGHLAIGHHVKDGLGEKPLLVQGSDFHQACPSFLAADAFGLGKSGLCGTEEVSLSHVDS